MGISLTIPARELIEDIAVTKPLEGRKVLEQMKINTQSQYWAYRHIHQHPWARQFGIEVEVVPSVDAARRIFRA